MYEWTFFMLQTHTVKCINYTVINMKTTHGAAYNTAKWISEISLEKNVDDI